MKIATWNINSLTVRLPQVLDWLAANPVDVLALQELKLTDDKFPFDAFKAAGYEAAVFGQKTYNGVALLTRTPVTNVVKNIPGFDDEQARVITASVNGLRIVNVYIVNGQEPGSDKFEYKMSWMRGLRDWLREEVAAHEQVVLLGDFNIAPEDRDSYDPVGLTETIHHTSEERYQFNTLTALGLVDAFRLFEQPEKSYSWWDYRDLGFRRNKGLRIDHILVSNALKDKVRSCSIDKTPRKNDRPSDHAPVVVELAL